MSSDLQRDQSAGSQPAAAHHPDVVLSLIDRMYAWHAARAGMTIFGAYVGRLVLTSHRLIFLSTGSNGILRAAGAQLLGGAVAQLTLGQTPTEQLDTAALTNQGSVNLDLTHISRTVVRRRFDLSSYLVVEIQRVDGSVRFLSFMSRYGMNRSELLEFEESIQRARHAAISARRVAAPAPHDPATS